MDWEATREEMREETIKTFAQIYYEVLVRGCKIEVELVDDEFCVYTLVTYSLSPRLDVSTRRWINRVRSRYKLTPWGAKCLDSQNP